MRCRCIQPMIPSVPPGSTDAPRPAQQTEHHSMPRANRVLSAAERKDTPVVDTLILPHAQRQAHKGFLFGVIATLILGANALYPDYGINGMPAISLPIVVPAIIAWALWRTWSRTTSA